MWKGCVATEAPELDEFLGGRVVCFVFRSDLCLLTEFALNGAISARCGHFIHCLYHVIPNLHILHNYTTFLLHMITSIANSVNCWWVSCTRFLQNANSVCKSRWFSKRAARHGLSLKQGMGNPGIGESGNPELIRRGY
jgi:hypothetical protein